jgi:hypothetical protein
MISIDFICKEIEAFESFEISNKNDVNFLVPFNCNF